MAAGAICSYYAKHEEMAICTKVGSYSGRRLMKTPTNIIKISLAAAILALLTFNPGSSRCQPQPVGQLEAQPQARQDQPRAAKIEDRDRQDEKSQRFRELESLIKGSLMIQYQRLDAIADLKDQLD
jgi:hypothetical protein